jgi:hypothetical protein
MKTGIPELDEMIGLRNTGGETEEIDSGSVMLIRGEPGSGKTTLGLQILSNNAKDLAGAQTVSHPPQPADRAKFLFISLEQEPTHVLRRVHESYLFFQDTPVQEILHFDRQELDGLLRDLIGLQRENSWEESDSLRETIVKPIRYLLQRIREGISASAKSEGLLISIVANFLFGWGKYWENDLAIRRIARKKQQYEDIRIILFDSLDVFVEIVRKYRESTSERLIVNAIRQSLLKLCPNAVVIFIGEYHYFDPAKDTVVSESFLCDIEISLFTEPIVVPQTWTAQFASPLGNNYLSLLQDDSTSLHTQSFCRILKSRNLQNQSRRCSYDILSGKGLEFFPSYPGDGHFLMFTENEPQVRIWRNFCQKDIPASYPALRYEDFDRMSMQRTSNIWRRVRYCVPTRTDLVLASFDNYWINWYEEIYLKWTIIDSLKLAGFDPYIPEGNPVRYRLFNAIGSAVSTPHLNLSLLPGVATPKGLRCIRCHWIRAILDQGLATICEGDEREKFLRGFHELFLKYYFALDADSENRDFCATVRIRNDREAVLRDTTGGALNAVFANRDSDTSKCYWKSLVDPRTVDRAREQLALLGGIFHSPEIGKAVDDVCRLGIGPQKELKTKLHLGYLHAAMKLTQRVEDRSSMLLPIMDRELRLFGERRSDLLRVLEKDVKNELRPICRPRFFGNLKSREHMISLPYNANVGFYVFKKEDYQLYADRLIKKEAGSKYGVSFRELVCELHDLIRQAADKDAEPLSEAERKGLHRYLDQEARAGSDKKYFKTWEEIIAFAIESGKTVVLETQTLDTYLSSLLEIFWSCGGELTNQYNYKLSEKPETVKARFNEAFAILALLFGLGIIKADSSCDVDRFTKRYGGKESAPHTDWLLMRHWYSTFIDLVTAKEKTAGGEDVHKWKIRAAKNRTATLDIMPVPASLSVILSNGGKDEREFHHSCLGDWHLAIIKGSENTKLGIDLINNLMSSERICERAFANADIPTVEDFYTLYGESRCVNPSLRSDIRLPRTTYNQIKNEYLEHAYYRSQIYDYHHCMREFHSVLEFVRELDFGQIRNLEELRNAARPNVDLMVGRVSDAIDSIAEKYPEKSFLSE